MISREAFNRVLEESLGLVEELVAEGDVQVSSQHRMDLRRLREPFLSAQWQIFQVCGCDWIRYYSWLVQVDGIVLLLRPRSLLAAKTPEAIHRVAQDLMRELWGLEFTEEEQEAIKAFAPATAQVGVRLRSHFYGTLGVA